MSYSYCTAHLQCHITTACIWSMKVKKGGKQTSAMCACVRAHACVCTLKCACSFESDKRGFFPRQNESRNTEAQTKRKIAPNDGLWEIWATSDMVPTW
eukprot:1161545-Pelagomonas_calceolata.AAC.3